MKLAVLCDLVEEGWPSMDLMGDVLLEHGAGRADIELTRVRPRLPAFLGGVRASVSGLGANKAALALGRYAEYPLHAALRRRRFDWFHIADHSYAHLALVLPSRRVGVFCHDLDAFRPALESMGRAPQRALARTLLAGLRRARFVFHSTEAVRDEILAHGLVPEECIVAAPYGTSPEFTPAPTREDLALEGQPPFVLHVGSLISRKNPEQLLRVFAAVLAVQPALDLVQIGGSWNASQRELIETLGLAGRVRQIERIWRREELAAYYRRAAVVVLPSLSEGFGLPVIEALACGAPLVASDIPVLRQVGAEGAVFAAPEDLGAWREAVLAALEGRGPERQVRLGVAARYTWARHTATILGTYRAAASGA